MLRVEEARETVRPIDHLHVQGLFIVGWACVCVVTHPRWCQSSAGATTSCTVKGVHGVLGSTEAVMPVCTTSFISGLDSHVPLGQDERVELWHVLSTLRNTTISIPRLAGHDTIAAIARHPERVLDLIDRPPHPRTSRDGRL